MQNLFSFVKSNFAPIPPQPAPWEHLKPFSQRCRAVNPNFQFTPPNLQTNRFTNDCIIAEVMSLLLHLLDVKQLVSLRRMQQSSQPQQQQQQYQAQQLPLYIEILPFCGLRSIELGLYLAEQDRLRRPRVSKASVGPRTPTEHQMYLTRVNTAMKLMQDPSLLLSRLPSDLKHLLAENLFWKLPIFALWQPTNNNTNNSNSNSNISQAGLDKLNSLSLSPRTKSISNLPSSVTNSTATSRRLSLTHQQVDNNNTNDNNITLQRLSPGTGILNTSSRLKSEQFNFHSIVDPSIDFMQWRTEIAKRFRMKEPVSLCTSADGRGQVIYDWADLKTDPIRSTECGHRMGRCFVAEMLSLSTYQQMNPEYNIYQSSNNRVLKNSSEDMPKSIIVPPLPLTQRFRITIFGQRNVGIRSLLELFLNGQAFRGNRDANHQGPTTATQTLQAQYADQLFNIEFVLRVHDRNLNNHVGIRAQIALADAFIYVCDITRKRTIEVPSTIVRDQLQMNLGHSKHLMLCIGNKADRQNRNMTKEYAHQLCSDRGWAYHEFSAHNGSKIEFCNLLLLLWCRAADLQVPQQLPPINFQTPNEHERCSVS